MEWWAYNAQIVWSRTPDSHNDVNRWSPRKKDVIIHLSLGDLHTLQTANDIDIKPFYKNFIKVYTVKILFIFLFKSLLTLCFVGLLRTTNLFTKNFLHHKIFWCIISIIELEIYIMIRYYMVKDGTNTKIPFSLTTKVIIPEAEARAMVQNKCNRTKTNTNEYAFFAESDNGYLTRFASLNELEGNKNV